MERPTRRAFLEGGAAAITAVAFAGCRRGNKWPTPPPFLTPQDRFYNRLEAKLAEGKWKDLQNAPKLPPPPDIGAWRLAFRGFRQEREITAKALSVLAQRFGQVSYLKTLRCTGDGRGNRLSSTGLWTGIPLIPVLAELGIPDGARRLRVKAHDGFSCNLQSRFTHARDGRPALMATHLNGEPLLPDRGAPCRLLIPDRYGFKNIKWPTEILVTEHDVAWGDHEVDKGEGEDDGLVRFVGKILSPDVLYDGETVSGRAGEVTLHGVAFGGMAPIAEVRLRVNEGPWEVLPLVPPAELGSTTVQQAPGLILPEWPITEVSVPWSHTLTLKPGTWRVQVMATNALGEEQPEADGYRKDGDSSWPFVELQLT